MMREIPIIEEEEHNLLDISLEPADASLMQQTLSSFSSGRDLDESPPCSSRSAQYVTRNRKVFIATMLVAVTIVGSSLVTRSGSDTVTVSTPKQRIVDVNGPPDTIAIENATLKSITSKSSKDGGHHSKKDTKKDKKNKKKKLEKFHTVSRLAEDEGEPLLIINNDDDQVPTGIVKFRSGGNFLHASDALECRESVISFVINATDGKDECDGLKRAFDKTCNSDASEEATSKQQQHEGGDSQDEQRRRRRLLFAASQPETIRQRWQLLVFQTSRWITSNFVYPLLYVISPKRPSIFFAEDAVAGNSWQDAQYLVENNLVDMMHKKLSRRLKSTDDEDKDAKDAKDEQHEFEDAHDKSSKEKKISEVVEFREDDQNEDKEKEENPATKEPKAVVEKPKQSLTLPTSNQHMSGTMLSETLLLQKEDTVKIAMKAAANHTTNATTNEAADDPAASSKAVQDATAAVSAVLNDPSSVEARTCCASILNVFHENCDTPDQEVVSDRKLFLIVFVIAICGMVKSLIRHYQIRWLPEAAGCILVGGTYRLCV
jgi:hypothetical protein